MKVSFILIFNPIFNLSQSNEDSKTDWSKESFKLTKCNQNELMRYHVATEMSSYLHILAVELIKTLYYSLVQIKKIVNSFRNILWISFKLNSEPEGKNAI